MHDVRMPQSGQYITKGKHFCLMYSRNVPPLVYRRRQQVLFHPKQVFMIFAPKLHGFSYIPWVLLQLYSLYFEPRDELVAGYSQTNIHFYEGLFGQSIHFYEGVYLTRATNWWITPKGQTSKNRHRQKHKPQKEACKHTARRLPLYIRDVL